MPLNIPKIKITRTQTLLGLAFTVIVMLGYALHYSRARMVNSAPQPLIDLSAIDLNSQPCNDFYQYACGNWLKNFQLPEDQASYTKSFDSIYNRNLEIENDILNKYSLKNYSLPAQYSKKLGQFYASCMNTDVIEKTTSDFIQKGLAEIDSLTEKNQIPGAIARLHLIGVNVLFGFGPNSDAKDSNQEIAEFSQGGMGLPNNSYYLDAVNADARDQYLTYISRLLRLAGVINADEALTRATSATILGIESSLARAALRIEELSDPQKLYHPIPLTELRLKLSAFDVDAFFHGLGLKGIERVNITEPNFFDAVNQLISSIRLEDLKLYFKWSWLRAVAPYLSDRYREEVFNFEGAYLNGEKKMKDRWKFCVSTINNAMGEALGEAYIHKTFGNEGRKKSQEMITEIRQAFKVHLSQVNWIDEPTRTQALEKLGKILPKVGYPNHFRNYDGLKITDSFIENAMNSSLFEVRRLLNLIGKPVDKTLWDMAPQTVNAYYNPSWNEIVFPAGILQPPFFSKDANHGANFGAIGPIMGHELTHGFDNGGRQYDAQGNLMDWWTPKASQAFEEKSECMVSQFNEYEVAPDVFMNGRQTLGENIADLGGIKLAFEAFQKLTQGQKPAPPVGEFNETQQFFLAFAQSWCTIETPESAKLNAQTDVHASPKYRVNGTLINMPAFGEAFGCTSGAPMMPADHCSLW